MSAPKVDAKVPPKTKNTRKRALSTSEGATSAETRKPAKRAKTSTPKVPKVQVDLTGPFNILYTYPSFSSVYAPNDTPRDPEALYKMLLDRRESDKNASGTNTKPSDHVWTAQINIPSDYKTNPNPVREQIFENILFEDPASESPFELTASNFKDVPKPTFTTKFGRPATNASASATEGEEGDAWNAPGIKATLKIAGGGSCGISSNSGTLALRPLWRKVGKDGEVMELFEGNMTFKAKFNSMYSRMGFGKSMSCSMEFWAIRGE